MKFEMPNTHQANLIGIVGKYEKISNIFYSDFRFISKRLKKSVNQLFYACVRRTLFEENKIEVELEFFK